MAKNIVSIDIGSKNTHFVVGKITRHGVKVRKSFHMSTPANSVIDGRLEDSMKFKNALKEELKNNKIRTKNLIFNIQSASIISRDLLLPVAQKEQLTGAVAYEMEQYASVDGRNKLTEFRVVDEVIEEGNAKNKIRVATVPKEMAENYYRLAKELHRIPYVLDVHPNAVSKLFSREMDINEEKYVPDKAVAVVDFGYKTTHICIINKGILEFNRLMSYGSNDLDLIIAGFYNFSPAEAEAKKINEIDLGFLNNPEEGSDGIYDSMRLSLVRVANELQKVIQYYTSRTANVHTDTMYIYGGGSRLKGFDAYLKETLALDKVVRIEHLATPAFLFDTPDIEVDVALNALSAMLRI